jgi:D-galactose 1-dehydrogenase
VSAAPIGLGIVGIGKIARDQHLPTIAASPDFALVAGATRHGELDKGPTYPTIEAMFEAHSGIEAVSLCQPPQVRFDAALTAIAARKHVFLEKPPGATLSEVETLAAAARANGVTLFASWHSRYAPGVAVARDWLAARSVRAVSIEWKEDVRVWHPGQKWIWEAGGMGVFDPGINALSIATAILPPFHLIDGMLDVPSNCQAPIAASLRFATVNGAEVRAELDFLQTGPQTWDITVETDCGRLVLAKGGSELAIEGEPQYCPPEAEYRGLYDRFAALIRAGESDVDVAPLRHVADAFLRADCRVVAPFEE